MNKPMETVHPEEDHFQNFVEGSQPVPLSQICHKSTPPVSRHQYKIKRVGLGYYLHKEGVELKDLTLKHHPLHPQHPLAMQYDYPCDKSFVCSFCGETKQSRCFYQCSDDQCDFYLHTSCEFHFKKRPELLDKYEIQHVFHQYNNHRLAPYIIDYRSNAVYKCAGCAYSIVKGSRVYKCIACFFYLHTECAQVPEVVVQHQSHPQHPLVLLQDNSNDDLRCTACLKWIEGGFYLHCNHCPTFSLDLQCYFRFKPTFKHEAHEHPLAFFSKIYDRDVRCYACNTPCTNHLFRCFTCNFNVHSGCHALPITVKHDDHVDLLTLTTSFKEDGKPTTNYCDICEKKRDPDRGIYLCKECSFIAHFECALSQSTAEEITHAYAPAPWRQKIEEANDRSDEKEDMTLTNEKVSLEIFDQLNVEIEKLGEVIKKLFIKKKEGEQLTGKIQEFDKRRANAEDMLRRLNQSVPEELNIINMPSGRSHPLPKS